MPCYNRLQRERCYSWTLFVDSFGCKLLFAHSLQSHLLEAILGKGRRGGVGREPSAQLTFMVMGRRPCKYGVYQQAWGFPLLNIEAKSCVQSVWHHWLHVRCQCFMTRAFWLNLAGGIYWDFYYLLMPLIILHYTTVHERVCLCTHFVRTHLMKKLLLECSVQIPLAGVSEQRERGRRGR